jgi:indole-3-glycerol phosphate synthase
MSVLQKIVEKKRERLAAAKARISAAELKALIRDAPEPLDFGGAIKRKGEPLHLIAEVKKASPTRGLIREDFDPGAIARVYKEKRVDAMSVLTEEDFFQGSLEFLSLVKNITALPVLRKDFIVDEYQIYEARANRADALLLIAALLETRQAEEYLHLAEELGMSVLFEVHDSDELEMALLLAAPVIGINNRNLKTLAIDLNTTFTLKKEIPADRIVVSESGISRREHVLKLEAAGIDAMLIGTSLMESRDIGRKIDELRGKE